MNTTRGFRTGITGTRFKSTSTLFKILSFIERSEYATKYECLTQALGYTGSKRSLRGNFSCLFVDLRQINILTYNPSNHSYSLTEKGTELLNQARNR